MGGRACAPERDGGAVQFALGEDGNDAAVLRVVARGRRRVVGMVAATAGRRRRVMAVEPSVRRRREGEDVQRQHERDRERRGEAAAQVGGQAEEPDHGEGKRQAAMVSR